MGAKRQEFEVNRRRGGQVKVHQRFHCHPPVIRQHLARNDREDPMSLSTRTNQVTGWQSKKPEDPLLGISTPMVKHGSWGCRLAVVFMLSAGAVFGVFLTSVEEVTKSRANRKKHIRGEKVETLFFSWFRL